MTTDEIGAIIQTGYETLLPSLMERAATLVRTLPAWNPKLKDLVCRTMAQRIFLLLQDAKVSFLNNGKTGYFTTAILARSIMENGIILSVIHRDTSNQALSAFLQLAKEDARRRRDGLAKLCSAKAAHIAKAAISETAIADRIYQQLLAVGLAAGLPGSRAAFPNMSDRCRQLGDSWEFHYEATYRDLCGAVHGGFLKTTHAPSVSLRAPDRGAAVLYEHCVAVTNATEFWAVAVMEICSQHPDKTALESFRNEVGRLLEEAAEHIDKIGSVGPHHTLSF